MDPVTLTTADGLDLFDMLGRVLWTALRIGAAVQVLPMLGARGVPARSRLVFTIALAAALSAIVVLGFPSALGAAAARLIL